MLGGLTIYPPVANFLQCICAKNYANWLAVDKVITKIIRLTFFGPPCMVTSNLRLFDVPVLSGTASQTYGQTDDSMMQIADHAM